MGSFPASNIFPIQEMRKKKRAAFLLPSELRANDKWIKASVESKCRPAAESDLDQKLRDITMEEAAEKAWLNGSFSAEEVSGIIN